MKPIIIWRIKGNIMKLKLFFNKITYNKLKSFKKITYNKT